MKFVCIDNKEYFPNKGEISIVDTLAPQIYKIAFRQFQGMYLETYIPQFKVDEKLYGESNNYINSIVNGYTHSHRNMGVIFSGDKGLGKTLTAKVLCNTLISKDYPVILCNTYMQGISDFISKIEQPCVVLFDEFDKIFTAVLNNGDDTDKPQEAFLSLFDGTDMGNKLFIITCNNIYKLNSYFINRPGRFHYHVRFEYPQRPYIEEYLNDNVLSQYASEIQSVLSFCNRKPLNFDCLRAIIFELNMGHKFNDIIDILNILDNENYTYTFTLTFNNGETSITHSSLILYNDDSVYDYEDGQWINNFDSCSFTDDYLFGVYVYSSHFIYNSMMNCYVYNGKIDRFSVRNEKIEQKLKNIGVKSLTAKLNLKTNNYKFI